MVPPADLITVLLGLPFTRKKQRNAPNMICIYFIQIRSMHRFNGHDAAHDACGGVMSRAAKVGVQDAKRNACQPAGVIILPGKLHLAHQLHH